MQQRAALTRALAPDPAILLMDEPFAALNALTRARPQEEIRSIWQATGKTVLFVTHSVDEAAVYLGTRLLVMSRRPGRVVLDRSSELPYSPDPLSAGPCRAVAPGRLRPTEGWRTGAGRCPAVRGARYLPWPNRPGRMTRSRRCREPSRAARA
ncbi:hypothetical protein SAMN05421869_12365 [Nonomuraea jiangxiensis]|uniref:NitT/TauT family transport system ATP-binding protein n=1 Tax=Nonomuraea jiangxiensis TaxID=633440 RepID=A0A1G9I2U4_9ACTN|nr:hypothetical protein SAMN05421869_12365 [Nonomuraea jiangxiensis]